MCNDFLVHFMFLYFLHFFISSAIVYEFIATQNNRKLIQRILNTFLLPVKYYLRFSILIGRLTYKKAILQDAVFQ